MWISGHSNIAGNEKADATAKSTHNSTKAISISGFFYSDAKKIKKYIKTRQLYLGINSGHNRRPNLMKSKSQYSRGPYLQYSPKKKKLS
jgi:hypothetical protein